MRVILIRHYKTLFNVSERLMGWTDSPKVEDWREDLVFVHQVLQQHLDRIDRIYSSALPRSRQTASYFAEALGIGAAEAVPELNEINYGALSEKPKDWVVKHYPQHKRDPDFVYPQGESFRQVQERSVRFMESLQGGVEGETALCVIHAGVIRALLSHYLELDYAAQLARKISHRYVGVLSFAGGIFRGYEEWGVRSGFSDAGFPPPLESRKRG